MIEVQFKQVETAQLLAEDSKQNPAGGNDTAKRSAVGVCCCRTCFTATTALHTAKVVARALCCHSGTGERCCTSEVMRPLLLLTVCVRECSANSDGQTLMREHLGQCSRAAAQSCRNFCGRLLFLRGFAAAGSSNMVFWASACRASPSLRGGQVHAGPATGGRYVQQGAHDGRVEL